MEFERAAGILLHPTSLPGPFGIGDLGEAAYHFVDFLEQTHQKLWQVLPLAPTGYGDSPYAALSAFAGNPLLISLETLVGQGLLDQSDLADVPAFPNDQVDFGPVIEWKMSLLRRSFAHFKTSPDQGVQLNLISFDQENSHWLEDYSLFMACKQAHEGKVWSEWEREIALRDPASVVAWRTKLADEIEFQKYVQFLFFQQWLALKDYANARQVKIVGDIPIFVAYDSAEVWAQPDLFFLDPQGRATVVAGVPPDYFSATGQYWGNPLYRWDYMARTGYAWWIARFRQAFRLTDYLRLDHFRGFAAFWEVPANPEQTAANGRWVAGPGVAFFQAIEAALGERPIIAEDLGVITPDVNRIREEMHYPGMRVIQFAFGAFETDATDPYLPHNYEPNTVVYTGTHDNDTTAGWYSGASDRERFNARDYLNLGGYENLDSATATSLLVRLAYASVANLAIVPMQDLLGVGSEARMNFPGKADNNWRWRYDPSQLSDQKRQELAHMTELFARWVPTRAVPLKGQGNF